VVTDFELLAAPGRTLMRCHLPSRLAVAYWVGEGTRHPVSRGT
jgi:hypothetical protein